MSVKTIQEFNNMLAQDCQLSIEEFYETNPWDTYPRPYSVVSDYWDPTEPYRILFPQESDEMDRPTQYYTLSRFISNLRISRTGIVAFLELEIPHRPEISEMFWGRTARAAMIGSAVRRGVDREKTVQYETEVTLFDMIDGKLEFCTVADQSIWEDVIDNVALFRDFLYVASHPTSHSPYRWSDAARLLVDYGFDFDFNNENQRIKFTSSQTPLIPV